VTLLKISNKIIEYVISEIAGEDVVPLVLYLKNKKNISEFKLAESIGKEVNPTRNMLYRLYDHSLVSFIRRKDKKKGWYIYYWTFNMKMIKNLFISLKEKRIEKLNDRLCREEKNTFFACENQCMRLDFEKSTTFEFKCPECGELMNHEDNSQKIKDIQKEIKEIEKELKKK